MLMSGVSRSYPDIWLNTCNKLISVIHGHCRLQPYCHLACALVFVLATLVTFE